MAYLVLRITDTPLNRELKILAESEAKHRGYKGLGDLVTEVLSKELANHHVEVHKAKKSKA
jgi:hypothetical protein